MSNTELSLIPLTEEQKQGAQMLLDWLDARFQICQHDATMYQIIIYRPDFHKMIENTGLKFKGGW